MAVVAVDAVEHAKNEIVVAEAAKPMVQSKISWLAVAVGIQSVVTAAVVGDKIPPIPFIPAAIQPLVSLVLSGLIIFFRQKLAKQARS